MSCFPDYDEEADPGPHHSVSFVWLIADAEILSNSEPASSSYLWQPDIIGSSLAKMVIMSLDAQASF